jgi:hypothetical protein
MLADAISRAKMAAASSSAASSSSGALAAADRVFEYDDAVLDQLRKDRPYEKNVKHFAKCKVRPRARARPAACLVFARARAAGGSLLRADLGAGGDEDSAARAGGRGEGWAARGAACAR